MVRASARKDRTGQAMANEVSGVHALRSASGVAILVLQSSRPLSSSARLLRFAVPAQRAKGPRSEWSSASTPERTVKQCQKWVDAGDKGAWGGKKRKGKASLSLLHDHFTGHHCGGNFFLFDSGFKPPFFISRNMFSTAVNNNIKLPWKISKI